MSDEQTHEPTVREAIEAAIDQGSGAVPAAAPTASPATGSPGPASDAAPAASYLAPAQGAAPEAAPASPTAPAKRTQGELFAPQERLGRKDPAAAPAAAPGPEIKAPASWKADLRERWKGLPPEVQGEIVRREREIEGRMQDTASLRRFAGEFQRIAEPYRAFIEAEGANPLAAFHDYLKTATMLRMGPPAEKARMLAALVQQFQIPVEALDQYLAQAIRGAPAPQGVPGLGGQMPQQQFPQQMNQAQFRDPRLDQLLAQAQQHQTQTLRTDIESFATDGKHEFFEDVRATMADVMDAGAKRGIEMNLEDAYIRACQIEPAVRKVLEQRAAQGNVGVAARTLARARHAASSLPPQSAPPAPRGNGAAAPGTVRDAILQSIDTLQSNA